MCTSTTPHFPRSLSPLLLLASIVLGLVLALVGGPAGCASLQSSPTAKALVYFAADPIESLVADGLASAVASMPTDPSALQSWLVQSGLTEEESREVTGDLVADAQLELSSVALWVEEGAFGRLCLSALGREKPSSVGPREAARYLLARARSTP